MGPATKFFINWHASKPLLATSPYAAEIWRWRDNTVPAMLASLWQHAADVRPATLGLGLVACAWLLWSRSGLKPLLVRDRKFNRMSPSIARFWSYRSCLAR